MKKLWWCMKEQKETTFKNEYKKALNYSKRILNRKMYHSSHLKSKLASKYNQRVVTCVISFLKKKGYFDDERYVEKLKAFCFKKYYGIKKFNQLLNQKCINLNESSYTFEEEKRVLQSYLKAIKSKIMSFPIENRNKKILYYLKYRGFSNYNISSIDLLGIIK